MNALLATNEFESMDREVDSAEHSLELHLPYIFHTYARNNCPQPKIVPWLVGSTSPERGRVGQGWRESWRIDGVSE